MASSPTQTVLLSAIVPSKANPRKELGDLTELARSIEELGILQPLLLRPKGKKFEIVAGERRYRAAKQLKLQGVPAIVRELTNEQAARARLVENLQREDLKVLEEAEGLWQLVIKHKVPAADVAEKIGKSKAYVYARMKLTEVPPAVKKALEGGELSASVALLLARLPAAIAAKALPHLYVRTWTGKDNVLVPVSFRVAKEILRNNFAWLLSGAPWKITDEELPGGACRVCPKRSGSDRDLYEELDGGRADVCTDIGCYEEKKKAHGVRELEEAKKRGSKVLSKAEAKKTIPYEHYLAAGYVDLDKDNWEARAPSSRKATTWRKSLGGKVPDEDLILAVDPHDGRVRTLMREKRALAIAKERGQPWAKKLRSVSVSTSHRASPQDKKRKREREVRKRAAAAAFELLVEATEGAVILPADAWAAIIKSVGREVWADTLDGFLRRRGLEKKGASGETVLAAHVDELNVKQRRGLLVELLAHRNAYGQEYDSKFGENLVDLTEAFGVDLKGLQASAKKAVAAEERKKAAAKKKKTTKKKAAKKPA